MVESRDGVSREGEVVVKNNGREKCNDGEKDEDEMEVG